MGVAVSREIERVFAGVEDGGEAGAFVLVGVEGDEIVFDFAQGVEHGGTVVQAGFGGLRAVEAQVGSELAALENRQGQAWTGGIEMAGPSG